MSSEIYLTRFPIQLFAPDDRLEVTDFCALWTFSTPYGATGARRGLAISRHHVDFKRGVWWGLL